MSTTVNLDIPRTAEERLAREAESIWGLIKRIGARASPDKHVLLQWQRLPHADAPPERSQPRPLP